MKLFEYLNRMNEMDDTARIDFLDHLEMRNLCSAELTENDMWVLTHSASNNEYLQSKLSEEELAAETEAPDETVAPDVTFDPPAATEAPTEETPAPTEEVATEPTPDVATPTEETPAPTEEVAEETPTEAETTEPEEDDDSDIETSKEGIGVLALLGEIQEKLATGKPSPVEVAAIKALKKLVS